MPTYDLGLDHVSLSFATTTVFTDVTQGVFEGDRIGIVGRNGDGKSTLLRMFANLQQPDSGQVTRRGGLTFGMLDQRDDLDDDATLRYAALEDRADYEWASDSDSREIVEALLGGMNLEARVGTLSGGQRRRVDLARLLLKPWDILALDEPTNHLDMVTIHWLAEHLQHRWSQGQGALLLVTHDRWFLDEVCESMWEVHDGTIEPFEGGYSAYMLQRVERDRQAGVREDRRRNLARKELAWLSRGARARATKQRFHVKQANDLIADVPPMRNTLELKQMATSRLGKQVVDLIDVTQIFQRPGAGSGDVADAMASPAAVTATPTPTATASVANRRSASNATDIVPALYTEPELTGSVTFDVDTPDDPRLVDAGVTPLARHDADADAGAEVSDASATGVSSLGAGAGQGTRDIGVKNDVTSGGDVQDAGARDGGAPDDGLSGKALSGGEMPSGGLDLDEAALNSDVHTDITKAARRVTITGRKVLDDVTWLIGPGDRLGIVGANGAGKSTLLSIIDGSLTPTAGRVNIGKTVKFAVLSQRLDELEKLNQYKIKEVLSRYKPSYIVDGKEVTPAQLMERLGFESAQLMTPIRDLSGGQKRRMQLLLILLDEPNVLIMDEPGNDLDTDMLAVMEDLLDTWPGTLIVVSHDRYLLERVTDQQFALIGGKVRHLPGGVDDYMTMVEHAQRMQGARSSNPDANVGASGSASADRRAADDSGDADADDDKLTGKAFHDATKRVSAIERRLAKLEERKTAIEMKMADHDPSDFVGLSKLNDQLTKVGKENDSLEEEWMELSEQIE